MGVDVTKENTRILAVIGSAAVVAMGVVGVAAGQSRTSEVATVGPDMTTGVTVTKSTAPSQLEVSVAVPNITGPAPLPSEMQGLPG
jgi:hypothetical protein